MTAPAAAGRVLLADGTPAVVRRLGPGDADDVLALHRRLTERDRYLRFSTVHPADLEGFVRTALEPGGPATTLGASVQGALVAVVQVFPLGGERAEVAAVVDPRWRSHGLATALLEQVAGTARRLGVRCLVAEVLAENGVMLDVLAHLGLPLRRSRDGSTVHLEIALHDDQRYADATEARFRTAAVAGLRPVLRPETVAVVGAGRRPGSVGRAVLRRLRAADFGGAVVAVNPYATRVEEVPCWPRVTDLPCTVDLAVVCVPAAALPEVLEDCGRHGVGAALVLSSGVSAVPGLPARVREVADRAGLRLVGPNSLGVAGTRVRLDATFAARPVPAGDVGLVAQSGGVVLGLLASWAPLGIGVTGLLAVGDAWDVGPRDALAWFDEDPATGLVVVYLESEPDLRGLARTAAHLSARVPVLAVASGASEAGRRAAASHTARAATPAAVRAAAFAAGGVQTLPDLTSLSAAVGLLRGQPLPRGRRVAVLTNLGGGGVLTADACTAAGLAVPPLPAPLRARLAEVLPPLAATGNPVDTGAVVDAAAFADALRLLVRSPDVDAVVTVTAATAVSDPAPGVPAALTGEPGPAGAVPVLDVRLGAAEAVRRIDLPVPGDRAAGHRFLVSVADPAVAAAALRVAVERRELLGRLPEAVTPGGAPGGPPAGVDVRAAAEVVAAALGRDPAGGWLRPDEVVALCRAAGVPLAPATWVTTPREAGHVARRHRGPFAVKGVVEGVVHKADAGLLRLPVSGPVAVERVVEEWAAAAGERWIGALVQRLVPPGEEYLVGAVQDPAAGAVVAVGPGGRAADALGHRVHRLAPLSPAAAAEMVTATGLFATEHGAALDRAPLTDCLRRVAWLADAVPGLAELEVNPLVVSGGTASGVDVRARVQPPG